MPGPNQLERLREDVHVTAADLLAVPAGTITRAGLRNNIDVCMQYLAAWLGGNGCVPIHNLMEDAATAEISRAQLWQWIRHRDAARRWTAVTLETHARRGRVRAGRNPARDRRRRLRRRALSRVPPSCSTGSRQPGVRAVSDPARLRRRSTEPGAFMNLQTAAQIESHWKENPRWNGVTRGYTAEDVVRLRGTVHGRALARAPRRREALELPARASRS